MSRMDEQIVVAEREAVFQGERLTFHGFLPIAAENAEAVLAGLCVAPRTERRGDVEEEPALLQPIPYVVVVRSGGEVFSYRRLAGGGERRLHGRVSIGVGGHMNRLFDRDSLTRVVTEEAAREVTEELEFRDGAGAPAEPGPARILGLINDDTGAVQRVHIGLLAVVEVPREWHVEVRERDRLEGRWTSVDELRNEEARARLEEWSVHALEGLPALS